MTTSNRRRWYELILLALACWAATAAHEAHADNLLSGASPPPAQAAIKDQAVNTASEHRPLAMTLAGALSIGLMMRRRGGGRDHRDR